MTEEPVTALAYGRHYYCYRLGFIFLNVSVVILRKAAVSFSMPFKLRCGTQPVISFVLLLAYIICKKIEFIVFICIYVLFLDYSIMVAPPSFAPSLAPIVSLLFILFLIWDTSQICMLSLYKGQSPST